MIDGVSGSHSQRISAFLVPDTKRPRTGRHCPWLQCYLAFIRQYSRPKPAKKKAAAMPACTNDKGIAPNFVGLFCGAAPGRLTLGKCRSLRCTWPQSVRRVPQTGRCSSARQSGFLRDFRMALEFLFASVRKLGQSASGFAGAYASSPLSAESKFYVACVTLTFCIPALKSRHVPSSRMQTPVLNRQLASHMLKSTLTGPSWKQSSNRRRSDLSVSE